jgi:hypothetical protein
MSGDEWEGLRAVFGELTTDAPPERAATAADVAQRAVELATGAAHELLAMSGRNAQVLNGALAALGPDEPVAWMLVSQARKSC